MAAQALAAGFLISQAGYTDQNAAADNYRWVWEIPSNDLKANKNLVRNWPTEK